MKTVQLNPLGLLTEVPTGTRLIDGLLAKHLNIEMACGGRGLCATCHVKVRQGDDLLSPKTAREERTLHIIEGAEECSRLACQCHIQGEGIVVDIPEGMYVQSYETMLDLVGQKALIDYLHPITGSVLIPKGKIVTRTMISVCMNIAQALRDIRET
jgi:ferredoxin